MLETLSTVKVNRRRTWTSRASGKRKLMMSIVDLGKRLVISAKLGDTDEVRLLMTNGAPFTTDWFGASPLHMSAQYGHLDTAEVLLRAGISRDARTKVDRTPLHLAAQEGHKDIVELLIGHGADVNAVDMLRMTPLHWAVERSHVPVIKFLLSCKADVHAINKFYKTPMDIADDNGADDIIQILKDYSNSSKRAKPKATYQQKIRLPAITKHPMVIQKQAASPFNVIKTDSVSAEQLKNVVNRTVRVFDPNMNSTATIAGCANTSAKISYSSRPVFIRANLGQSTSLKSSPSKSINEIDSTESTTQSCTNVLATLAALAEATAPNTTISTQEALQWLEMHGISMLPSDNSTVVASALEGGQTVSLTEAGKLALTWVKDQQSNNVSRDISSSLQNISIMNNRAMSNTIIPNQKIITIVAGQTQLPSIVSTQQQPFVLVGSHGSQIGDQPPLKKIKTYLSKKELKPVTNGKVCAPAIGENDKSSLQKELEKIKKEAAEYKAQLLLKEHEAELYRKQLEQLKRSQ